MSTLNVNRIVDASGGVMAPISSVFKNRIINGAMVIDQRNAGASGTGASNYTVDRWQYYGSQASKGTWQQNAGSVTPPAGFTNYLGFTSSSAYSITTDDQFLFTQYIEGFNTSDLGWGTANAKTITLSFWVRSSLTGTFGGSLQNSAQNRAYPFSYTITSANTWELKAITIAGDTTGTWVGATNGTGISVIFSLATGSTYSTTAGAWVGTSYITSVTGATSVVGTNGATFYITGVQLEVGTQATSFEYRQYQQELALCQRYYEKSFPQTTAPASSLSGNGSTISAATKASTGVNQLIPSINFKVTKRVTPTTVTSYSPTVAGAQAYNTAAGACSATALYIASDTNISFTFTGNVGGLVGDITQIHWAAEAEL
jgi:hypothetical protein